MKTDANVPVHQIAKYMDMTEYPMTKWLIKNHGFQNMILRIPLEEDANVRRFGNDVDQFSCVLRLHEVHYLFYSERLKHFSIGVKHDNPKGSPGTTERKLFTTVMIPRVIHTQDDAREVITALTPRF